MKYIGFHIGLYTSIFYAGSDYNPVLGGPAVQGRVARRRLERLHASRDAAFCSASARENEESNEE